ncbi:hypothetical protein [Caudoviricetes sp.]|nr:hypothetical protein [Caudoviricetes sp.]
MAWHTQTRKSPSVRKDWHSYWQTETPRTLL